MHPHTFQVFSMYYFYVLKSKKDRKLYWGFSSDLTRRFQEHQEGNVDSTRHRRPFVLVYYEAYISQHDAYHREQQMKLNAKAWGQLKRRIQASIEGT